jgi:hypothetical protein
VRALPAALPLLWLALGCGRRELDLLVPSSGPDPCERLVTQQECDENAALGCSFQPNDPGCRSDDPACKPGRCSSGDPFVRRVERSFLLNGKSFRYVGVSSWGLVQPSPCSTTPAAEREAWVSSAFDGLVASRARVARLYAFQASAGPNGDDFGALDLVIRNARRAGVRLLLVLEHGEGDCSQGEHRDTAWYSGGYLQPDGNYTRSYRDYASAVAERYREEPTVLGYVLLQGLGSGVETAALSSFVSDVGQLIHGLAPSQLLSLDLPWSDHGDGAASDFRELERLPAVDYIDVDDYVQVADPQPFDPALFAALREIDKPAVIGEGAFVLATGDAAGLAERGALARQRLALWRDGGLSGALV